MVEEARLIYIEAVKAEQERSMMAEKLLKDRYKEEDLPVVKGFGTIAPSVWITNDGSVHLAAEDIDLIANLVVERLKNE